MDDSGRVRRPPIKGLACNCERKGEAVLSASSAVDRTYSTDSVESEDRPRDAGLGPGASAPCPIDFTIREM
jgi:hypothetical protein